MPTIPSKATCRLLLAAVLATTLVAAGCGDDDSAAPADDVASIDGTAEGGDRGDAGDGEEASVGEAEDAFLEFARCMRENGVDMPDPDTSGGQAQFSMGPAEGESVDEETLAAARQACQPILDDAMGEAPPLDPEEEARIHDEMLEFARCMREHGIDMPDPDPEAVGGAGAYAPDVDTESPEFMEAQEACGGGIIGGSTGAAGGGGSSEEGE